MCHIWRDERPAGSTVAIEPDAARSQLAAALARVAGGDRAALQLVYRDTVGEAFWRLPPYLTRQGEAEDVLQDVYMTVWRRAETFDPDRASPITWLVAIARNRSIDRLRSSAKARRMQPIDDAFEVSDGAPSALAQVESGEEHRRLMDCLGELEPRHAAAIRSAFLDGATYEELAQRVDVPLGTMKSWIRRSLMRLQRLPGTMSDDHTIGRDDGTPLAAEYVLGVLGAAERRDFERRLAQEPRSAPRSNTGSSGSARSRPRSSRSIRRRKPGRGSRRRSTEPMHRAARRGGLWNSLPFWRWAAIGSAAVAAASIAALVVRRPRAGSERAAGRQARRQQRPGRFRRRDRSGAQRPDHRPGLGDQREPARAGTVADRARRQAALARPDRGGTRRSTSTCRPNLIQRIAADATLAVSLEPPGGSPTGQPTGPVIANGKLTNL